MSTSNLTSESVHIKLQFNDEYRRFFIKRNATFSDVLNNIKTILRYEGDLVVKYLDEENEWITFGSDTELETGLILNGPNVFRLLVSVPEVAKTRRCKAPKCLPEDVDSTSDEKPWRKRCKGGKRRCKGGRGRCRRWQEEKDTEKDEKSDEDDCGWKRLKCKGGKGRCKGGRRFRRWQEENDDNEKGTGKEEKSDEDVRYWKGKRWRRNKRFHDEEEKSDSLSAQEGDSLLSLEQIKQEVEKLQTEIKSLMEKKEVARGEFAAVKNQIRECRKTGAVDKILELRKSIGEKKTNLWDIVKEIKKIRFRIFSLKKLAKTKTA